MAIIVIMADIKNSYKTRYREWLILSPYTLLTIAICHIARKKNQEKADINETDVGFFYSIFLC